MQAVRLQELKHTKGWLARWDGRSGGSTVSTNHLVWQVDLPKDPSFSDSGPPPKHASFSQLPTSPHGASPHAGGEKANDKALEHQTSGAHCLPAMLPSSACMLCLQSPARCVDIGSPCSDTQLALQVLPYSTE